MKKIENKNIQIEDDYFIIQIHIIRKSEENIRESKIMRYVLCYEIISKIMRYSYSKNVNASKMFE